MQLRAGWVIFVAATLLAVPNAYAEDGDEEEGGDEGDGDPVPQGRKPCGPVPVDIQESPCDPLDEPCDVLSNPQPACGNVVPRANRVCSSVSHTPPGVTWDLECFVKWLETEVERRTGLGDFDVRRPVLEWPVDA